MSIVSDSSTINHQGYIPGNNTVDGKNSVDKTSETTGKPTTKVEPKAQEPIDRSVKFFFEPPKEKPDLKGIGSILGDSGGEQSISDLLKLLIQLGQNNWQSNMESRQSELNSQISSIQAQAEKMRSGSILGMVMGVVFGAIGIIGGIVNVVGSIKSFKNQQKLDSNSGIKEQQVQLQESKANLDKMNTKVASNRTKAEETLDPVAMEKYWTKAEAYEAKEIKAQTQFDNKKFDVEQLQKNIDKEARVIDHVATKWKAAGDNTGSLAKIGEGAGQSGAQIIQADSKLEEAKQADHQAKMQQANDYIQHFSNMIRDIRNLIAQINQDTNQTVRSVLNKA